MNEFIIIITGVLGATLTFYVSKNLKQGAVRASALLSLAVGLFFYCFPELLNEYATTHIPIVFMGTSFIGMVSSKVQTNYIVLAVAGFLFSFIYLSKSNFFDGYGGAIGTLALISLLVIMAFSKIIPKSTRLDNVILSLKRAALKFKKKITF
ncbi:hypothetical protein ULMS_09280 [Patiriisocius marinistellae]|uniref:Uncharacterized protein n=1 Tax=Patiriisocius marinistellae TaxID=2494560 RepID=A0A5J4FUB6_9FLAO|nr:hypothetical protein [Patiriisocius marinistellae]GEQ85420.1 hypothetical protein ULMS_09280 [Patiriisocius marinistellae]